VLVTLDRAEASVAGQGAKPRDRLKIIAPLGFGRASSLPPSRPMMTSGLLACSWEMILRNSPSHTQGRSRMLELGSSGSVRGVLGNEHPYSGFDPG
jgi:hypothetical protein